MFRLLCLLGWSIALPLVTAGSLCAHPLGNFTINHLARIESAGNQLRIHYVLDIAEIPTFQIMHAEADWDAARIRDWENGEAALVENGLTLREYDVALPLHLERTSSRTRPGAGGLPILYWTGDFTAPLRAPGRVSVRDAVYSDRRIGWKDIILPGLTDPTNALQSYPNALIGSPRQNDEAFFDVLTGGRIAAARVTGNASSGWGATSLVRASLLSDLVARDGQTPLWIALTILAAFGLGALHGLEPGHGKALLAFTLVGARATFKQAVILAGALTFAHTVAVLLLGLVLFFAAGFASENIFAWITLISGAAVAAIGARSLALALAHARAHARAHAHEHGHSHDHALPGTSPLRFGSAVVAAMSGGIAPCPAAIVVLLTALHLHRVGYGLALIIVFSLGLATILSGLGIGVVRSAAWIQRRSGFTRFAHFAPFLTGGVISVIGSVMLAQGLAATGVSISTPAVVCLALLAIAGFALVYKGDHMKHLRSVGTMGAVFVLAFSLSLYSFKVARGSDHQDSPTVVKNPLADITDVYAFPDPHDASRVALTMDVRPLIPSGMYSGIGLDPSVLYQLKIANSGVASGSFKENTVIQFTASGSGSSQQITLYGPATPNEVGTDNTTVAPTGTFSFGQVTTINKNIKVFVGPRRDPFFFDLAQFFKIVPDRNYMNHPHTPPATATSFRFASKNQKIVLNGVSYGTAGSNKCVIAKPHDYLAPYDVLSIVIELPKSMLAPPSGKPGLIGLWATTGTASGH